MMGVFSKLKDIFYDVEYVEEEVKEEKKPTESIKITSDIEEEEIKPEKKPFIEKLEFPKRESKLEIEEDIIPPKKEVKVKEELPERELFQSKKTFNFPILDDEEEKPKPRMSRSVSTNVMDHEKKRAPRVTSSMKKSEDPKSFKPSPIISPVYGVLNKDFKKEEHIRKPKMTKEPSNKARDYDSVRRKAFGTMEDQLDDTLKNNEILENVSEIEKELEKIDVNEKQDKLKGLLREIETETLTVGEMESRASSVDDLTDDVIVKEEKIDNKSLDEIGNKTLEHDLFNLIDSMYEKEEE